MAGVKKPVKICCKTCAYWRSDEAPRTKSGRLSPGAVAACAYAGFPASVRGCQIVLRPMRKNEGGDCACWRAR